MALVLFLVFSFFLQGALGELVCEELPLGICAFSISSTGKRCVLETYVSGDGTSGGHQCTTSEVVAHGMAELIETDECIGACGLDRYAVGISSDFLLDPLFAVRLCSKKCYDQCPNVVDLYHNLAIGEGASLADICKVQGVNPRRIMGQILSSGAANSPVSSVAWGPASAAACSPMSNEIPASSFAGAPASN